MRHLYSWLLVTTLGILPFTISGQDQTCSGSRTDIKKNVVKLLVTYTRTVDTSNSAVINTRYSILNDNNIPFYFIDFEYNKLTKNIQIRYSDIQKSDVFSTSLKFDPLSVQFDTSGAPPIFCVRNNIQNDTSLSMSNYYISDNLFSIIGTDSPDIFLHQFVTHDKLYRYDLDKFRKSNLIPHLVHARAYWANYYNSVHEQKIDSVELLEKKEEKARIEKEINDERLHIISDINIMKVKLEERENILKNTPVQAGINTQAEFKKMLDNLFFINLNETMPFNFYVHLDYNIFCDYKKVVNEPLPSPWINSNPIFKSKYGLKLYELNDEIKKIVIGLNNEKVMLCDYNPYDSIVYRHKVRCDEKDINPNDFGSELATAFNDLSRYYNRPVTVPTKFQYELDYISQTEIHQWNLVKKNLISKSNSTISLSNIEAFNKMNPHAKNGKYTVRLNSTTINNQIIGPKVDSAWRLYKYMIHIGLNYGTLFSIENDEDMNKELFYWNIFAIYHHFGVFAGYTTDRALFVDTKLSDYSEGGIYLAPSNIFFVKLGFAECRKGTYKSDLKPITGISLIFPFLQIEGGYNFALKYPYVMAGINLPLNK